VTTQDDQAIAALLAAETTARATYNTALNAFRAAETALSNARYDLGVAQENLDVAFEELRASSPAGSLWASTSSGG
jgi:hypothetical protein